MKGIEYFAKMFVAKYHCGTDTEVLIKDFRRQCRNGTRDIPLDRQERIEKAIRTAHKNQQEMYRMFS